MRTGEAPGTRGRGAAAQRGFTYLWLLLALAAAAAGLALLGERVQTTVQRDREAELVFRGRQIADAIDSYYSATPGAVKQFPMALADLLEDRRGPVTVRHLRRLYTDPFTGRVDWVLLRTADERIVGVRSRSTVAALRTLGLPPAEPGRTQPVSGRAFLSAQSDSAAVRLTP